uniref:Uncharacterized protein n=1 Tax=Tetradesmus obliquus TaxID=3088 RepID=A0A383VLP0_TETOB
MRYPCPHGEKGTKNECGKCSCKCSPDDSNTQASITYPNNGYTTTTAAADQPDGETATVQDAQLKSLFSGGLLSNQCTAKYSMCMCSASCCEGLVCGFPIIRGSAFEQEAGPAYEQTPEAAADQNKGSGKNRRRSLLADKQLGAVFEKGSSAAAALGPSCRPLAEVDLVDGVVNYGC